MNKGNVAQSVEIFFRKHMNESKYNTGINDKYTFPDLLSIGHDWSLSQLKSKSWFWISDEIGSLIYMFI